MAPPASVRRYLPSTLSIAVVWVSVRTNAGNPLRAAPTTKAMNIMRFICRGTLEVQQIPHCRHATRMAAIRRTTSP
eukprot:4636837-Pyramimonas_sp.AAC.1